MPAQEKFKLYLKSQGFSPVTIKNYLSDFNHFWGWLILTLKSKGAADEGNPQTIVQQISSQILNRYKSFLLNNDHPASTINRRLSTLRCFGQFCVYQTWSETNPAEEITNVATKQKTKKEKLNKEILIEFKKDLEKDEVSPITIRNYLSDLRHFLAWVEETVT